MIKADSRDQNGIVARLYEKEEYKHSTNSYASNKIDVTANRKENIEQLD